ncbi:hypothetical protein ABG768_009439, partial [Culter alburnus]
CVSRDPRSSVLGRAETVERRGSAHQKPHSDRVTGSTVEDSVGPRNVTPVTAARQDPVPQLLKAAGDQRKMGHCGYWAFGYPQSRKKESGAEQE